VLLERHLHFAHCRRSINLKRNLADEAERLLIEKRYSPLWSAHSNDQASGVILRFPQASIPSEENVVA